MLAQAVDPMLVLVVLLVLTFDVLDSVVWALGPSSSSPVYVVLSPLVVQKQVGVPLQMVLLHFLLLGAKHHEGWRHCAFFLQPCRCAHVRPRSRPPAVACGSCMLWCGPLCRSCRVLQVCTLDILVWHRGRAHLV